MVEALPRFHRGSVRKDQKSNDWPIIEHHGLSAPRGAGKPTCQDIFLAGPGAVCSFSEQNFEHLLAAAKRRKGFLSI